jgi:hypothetical protein
MRTSRETGKRYIIFKSVAFTTISGPSRSNSKIDSIHNEREGQDGVWGGINPGSHLWKANSPVTSL